MDALLGVSAKGSDVAANNILPAQLTVEAKLKAADKAVVGLGSKSQVSSNRDNYSSSRGAVASVASRNNALIDEILEGTLEMPSVKASGESVIEMPSVKASGESVIEMPSVKASGESVIEMPSVKVSGKSPIDVPISA
jgi:hypothetical protein